GGGYRARRIGCPAMGAEAEMLPGQRDAGVDVCLDCQWRMARGPLFPMEHGSALGQSRHVANYADEFTVSSSLHCWHWAFFFSRTVHPQPVVLGALAIIQES
ncbi:MAG: hypothetical protein ACRCSS_08800, partial [Shewanella sp.]